MNVFASVKPYFVGDGVRRLNSLNFAIRTEWKYTCWKRLKFGFVAEQRNDIEVGIYQIETNVLDSYQKNKQVQVFLPYYTIMRDSPIITTFLAGFEISCKQNFSYISPLQIEQRILSHNLTGFSLSLSVTSNTLVSELVVSYVVYDTRLSPKVVGASLFYEDYIPQISVSKSIAGSTLPEFRQVLHGLNGFILVLKEKFDIQFDTQFAPRTKDFTWTSTSSILYLAYSYFAVLGNGCSLCEGYPYFYLSNCLNTCPTGTFLINDTCINCPQGTNWNGSICLTVCSAGRSWNLTSQTCQCPLGMVWTGSICSSCPLGQVYVGQFGQCLCVTGNWNGSMCIQCHVSQVWNILSMECQCQRGSFWNGNSCIVCTNGRTWDQKSLSCTCPQGWNFDGKNCLVCTNGMTWNQVSVSCQCPSNKILNPSTNKCQCPPGYFDAGNNICLILTDCSGGRVYNSAKSVCECLGNTMWDGVKCVTCPEKSTWSESLKSCVCSETNKLYDPRVNICLCNAGYRTETNGSCSLRCGQNQVFNGTQCVSLCPVGSYYNGSTCTSFTPQCPPNTQWSGCQCISLNPTCPTGTTWSGSFCISQQSKCLPGYFYWNGSSCVPLSQKCPYQLEWINNMCLPTTNNCPSGSYFNGYQCIFYDQCQSNMIWNKTLVKCVCVEGTFWNGLKCIKCDYSMVYSPDGCVCPYGTIFNGSSCVSSSENSCKSISNANWNGTHCVCLPGYSAIDGKCICFGLQMTAWCNRCYQKPNSFYKNGICVCLEEFVDNNGQCVTQLPFNQTIPPSLNKSNCPVGTFWQSQRKQCLPCSDGCLSCVTCYNCLQCNVGFVYNPSTELCDEICGDGKRFRLQCDDGNNLNGDGCSLDCKVESGYTCEGGSPNSADKCTQYVPSEISFIQTGQSHLLGKIVLNIRVNYLPVNLTSGLASCKQPCQSLLSTTVTPPIQSPSVQSQYIGGAYHTISLTIDFRKEPIEKFMIDIALNPEIKQKYLPSIGAGNGIKITVEPMLLTLLVEKDYIR